MIPFDVGDDAGHVHLTLEHGRLAGPRGHVAHDVLDVGFSARFYCEAEGEGKSSFIDGSKRNKKARKSEQNCLP